MQTPKLNPCPFCGAEGILDEVNAVAWRSGRNCGRVTKYIAQCPALHCIGHHGKTYIDRETAIERWNRRPDKKEPTATYSINDIRKLIISAIEEARSG